MRFNDISVSIRLLVLVAVPVASLFVVGGSTALERYREVEGTTRLRELTSVATAAGNVLHESQKERGMSAGFLGSKGAKFGDALPDQRRATDEALARFTAVANAVPESEGAVRAITTAFLQDAKRIGAVRGQVDQQAIAVGEAVSFYTGLNGQLLESVDVVAKSSRHGAIVSVAVAYRNLMGAKELGGIERAILAATFGAGGFNGQTWEKFTDLVARQVAYTSAFERIAPPEALAVFEAASGGEAFAEATRFRAIAMASRGTARIEGVDPAAWFGAQTKKLDELRGIELLMASLIDQRAATIGEEMASSLRRTIAGLIAALLLTGGLAWVVFRSIVRPLARIVQTMKDVEASSDLSQRVDIEGRDEVGSAAAAFNGLLDQVERVIADVDAVATSMGAGDLSRYPLVEARGSFLPIRSGLEAALDGMNEILGSVRDAANRVEHAADKVSDTSITLASSAEELSSATNSSLSATEETDAMVQSNAENAKNVLRIGAEASAAATAGHEKLLEVLGAIRSIANASKDISRANKVINEIAFQTGILAVNASVEAARAGRSGRGFAVVAQEVHNLAQRSAAAAQETSVMIASAEQTVAQGVRLSEQAGESFESIAGRVREVHELIEEMVVAGDQQRLGVREITSAFQDVNASAGSIRQDSGSLSKSAGALVDLTRRLRSDLESFQTRSDLEVPSSPAIMDRPKAVV